VDWSSTSSVPPWQVAASNAAALEEEPELPQAAARDATRAMAEVKAASFIRRLGTGVSISGQG
jgi:hypothetical protein